MIKHQQNYVASHPEDHGAVLTTERTLNLIFKFVNIY